MAAEVILRVKVDKTQYKAFKEEVKKGHDAGGTNKVKDSLKETGEAAQNAKTKIQSLGEMLSKKIAWYSISMAISSVTVAFKEALQEIKAVDTQLTNVAKVSGKSMEDLQDLAEKAYSTASKYGVEASKYMEAVYEYTKAGFQENADVMAELSTKAMLVGDTTAAVADKFLISANAAWKYGKNVEELSLLVDKADYINNNYATTFDKIADGFPRVASVASMAGMTAEETMAALGTITATTQETASRAGTALRALILNILKDTTTEVEDGVTTTQEEIDSLRKVLEIYASDVVKAADATGSLINPMEAIAALSKAYREGALTERELYQIEQALGGKLRTNQLDALLKNFEETYTSMMDGMATAYGTADKEIETMLGSWESKSNILKNTWTEFVSKGLNSKMFKDLIDNVTTLLERFGGLNQIIPIVAGTMTALFAPAVAANIANMIDKVKNLKTVMKGLLDGVKNSKASISGAIGTAVSAIATIVTVAYTIYQNHVRKIRQEAEKATEEAMERASQAQQTTENLSALYAAYKKAEAANDGSTTAKQALTTATENLAKALGIEKDAIDDVTKSWDTLTQEELERQKRIVESAVTTAQVGLLREAASFHGTSNPIIYAAKMLQEAKYAETPSGVLEEYANENVSEEERIRRAVNAYKQTQEKIQALQAAYMAKSYSDIQKTYESGGLSSGAAVIAKDAFTSMSKKQIGKELDQLNSYLEEASFVKAYMDAVAAQEKYNETVEKFGKDSEEAAAAAAELAAAQEEAADEADKLAAAQKKMADAFSEVAGGAESAKKALQDYQDAIDANYVEENADAYAQAAQKAIEAMQKGFVDSPEITEFAKLYFGEDRYNTYLKQGKNLAKELYNDPYFQKIYVEGVDENGKTVFRDSLESAKELAKIMKEWDTDNNNILTVDKDGQRYTAARLIETDEGLKIIVEDWKLLAEGWGMAEGQLKSLLDYYGFLIPGMEAGTKAMLDAAEAAGALYTTADGIKQIDLGRVIEGAFASGKTEYEVDNIVKKLQELEQGGDIELTVDDTQIKDADEKTKTYLEKLDLVDVPHVVRIETDEADTQMQKILFKEKQIADASPTVTITAKDVISDKIAQIKERLRELPDEKTIAIKYQTVNKERPYASGTNNATGGSALVNERGAELIAANGYAWIAGGGRPVIANIPQGAKIWNASETKAILSNSNLAPLFGGIRAFAGGTSVPSAISGVSSTTMWEGANLFAQDYEDDELKGLQGMVSLRKSELELIKERGGSLDEQNEKQKQIQAAIVDVVNKLKNIGGKQEDINQLAAEWYQIQTEIEESGTSEMETLEKETSLRKSELSLLEAKGASNAKQVAKQREIQESLMAQVKYLKSIGGDQEEINKLLTEYYNIDKQITENEKQRAEQKKQKAKNREETLYSNLQAAIEKRMENINKKRDEALKQIDEEKKKLQEEHDLQQENQELQEKQLAVEKAREELANAKKQRTVRIFNSATGQWEWTYNASTVNAAKENLTNAKDALSEYKKEQAYQKRIDNLEAEQQEINDKYDARIAKWQAVLDTMEEPVKSIHSVLRSIEKHATEDMLPTIEKMNEALKNIGDGYVISPEIQKKMMGIGVGQTPGTYRNLGGVPVNVSGTPYGIGTQYNGDTYTFGNITLSEQQAKTTTVYQLTQMAGGLRSYAYGT